jgi:positive phototaxis protein PixI
VSNLTTTDRLKELLPELFSTKKLEGDYYLRFQLTAEISGLIDLKYVQESLTIKGDRITAVPNLPDYVIGLMSSRNQVFLAIDLAHLLGLPPETVNLRQYQTIVVQIDAMKNNHQADDFDLFGLTVKQIDGITKITSDRFIPITEDIPDNLRPFVRSAVVQESKDSTSVTQLKKSLLVDLTQLISHKINS